MATPGIEASEDPTSNSNSAELSDAERELVIEELKKTENEIATLRQLLTARQKHVAQLKRKLGISPLNEITSEMAQGLKTVKETPAYQKTSEMMSGTAESVASKINDFRNSSLFKSFESKLGAAVTNAKVAASTSIDHLAGIAGGARPSPAETSKNEESEAKNNSQGQSPLS
ncbi:hypothetical protein niasHT_004659 [Heterodera trifolii]|uniref:Tumor protein D52 n=1 Tax=Heterodera trifolii TaxID=157864 RepID=A0ABD2M978_9BILA